MPIGPNTLEAIRRVFDEAERGSLITDRVAVDRALALEEPEAVLRALTACDLPRGVWAGIQRAWASSAEYQPPPPPAQRSKRVGDYVVAEVIGRGGMGVVYRARDPQGGAVAIKVCLGVTRSESALRRFEAEVAALKRLDHPHVLQALDSGGSPTPWLALEYVEGGDVDDRLRRQGRLDLEEAVRIVAQVADALAHAHAQGVIHRDLKPSNILLRTTGEAVLADFGLTRALDASRFTQTGCMVGTLSFMAPEQARGKKEDGPATDVWGLGAVLYLCLTGELPIDATSPIELIIQLQDPRIRPPHELRPEIPLALSLLCLRCLSLDPAERPTAEAVARELPATLERARPTPSRAPPRAVWAALGALVWGGVLFAAIAHERSKRGTDLAASPAAPSPGSSRAAPTDAGSALERLDLGPAVAWPRAAWVEGRSVDPLNPLAAPLLMEGQTEVLADGRLRVRYQAAAKLLHPRHGRPDQLFEQEVRASGAPRPFFTSFPGGGVTWRSGTGTSLLGRALWRGAQVDAEVHARPQADSTSSERIFLNRRAFRRTSSDTPDLGTQLAFDLSKGWIGRRDLQIADVARSWRRVRFAPGGPPPRVTLDGIGLSALDRLYEAPAGTGHVAFYGDLAVREVQVLGRCVRPDLAPEVRCAPRALSDESELAFEVEFERTPSADREGGPFLRMGAFRLQLDADRLRLGAEDQRGARACALRAPARGRLRLSRLGPLLVGRLLRTDGTLVAELQTMLPAPVGPVALAYGSLAERVNFSSPTASKRSGGFATRTELADWRTLAQRAWSALGGGPGPYERDPNKLRALVEAIRAALDRTSNRRLASDLLARAGLISVLLGHTEGSAAFGKRLRATSGEQALQHFLAAAPFPAEVYSAGYGHDRYLPVREAGHHLLLAVLHGSDEALLKQATHLGLSGCYLIVGRRGGPPEQVQQLLEKSLRHVQLVEAQGGATHPLRRGEILTFLARYPEAIRWLDEAESKRSSFWWLYALRAGAHLNSSPPHYVAGLRDLAVVICRRDQRAGGSKERLRRLLAAGVIRSPWHVRLAETALVLGKTKLLSFSPLPPPESDEERAMAAYFEHVAGRPQTREGLGKSAFALLARARAGDLVAKQALEGVADPVVRAFAAADPLIRVPWSAAQDRSK